MWKTIIPSEDTEILTFNQYRKSECLIETIDGCKNNPKYSSQQ